MRIELRQVHIAGKLLLERGFIPELVMGSAVMLGVFMPLLQFFPMLRADGDGGVATAASRKRFGVFITRSSNEFDGLQGLLPKPAGLFPDRLVFDFFHTAGIIADNLPAAAPDAPKPIRAA